MGEHKHEFLVVHLSDPLGVPRFYTTNCRICEMPPQARIDELEAQSRELEVMCGRLTLEMIKEHVDQITARGWTLQEHREKYPDCRWCALIAESAALRGKGGA